MPLFFDQLNVSLLNKNGKFFQQKTTSNIIDPKLLNGRVYNSEIFPVIHQRYCTGYTCAHWLSISKPFTVFYLVCDQY